MLTVLHASDLQAGRPYRPHAANAFVALAHDVAPDVIVLSGDLTQRAKAREYRTVRGLAERLPEAPVLCVPGNHDVPLFRVWERVLDPYRNWKRYVSADRESVLRVPGATFVALDSSAPHRAIVNGRLGAAQVERAREAFTETPEGDARVLVVHHHFLAMPGQLGGRPLPGGARLLETFEQMRVDLLLGGHVHQTRVMSTRPGDVMRRGITLVSCGTTTSSRGRGAEEGANSLCVVRIGSERIEVTPHHMAEGEERFEPTAPAAFPRRVEVSPTGAEGDGS